MNTTTNIIKLIALLALIIGFFTSADKLFVYLTQQQKNVAIDNCLQSTGVYEFSNPSQGVRTTAPQKEYYQICLVDKGYTTAWKN